MRPPALRPSHLRTPTPFPRRPEGPRPRSLPRAQYSIAMKKYRFTAAIQPASVGSGGAYVLFPYDVEKEFGARGRVPVHATFDGIPYSGSLIRYGNPLHMLCVLKSVRDQLGKTPGDTVNVEVWKDGAERTVTVPPDLAKLLRKERLAETFNNLSYTHRREYCRWITEAKKDATRQTRLTKAIGMLKAGVKTPD
jgi:hypothetical protein